MSDVTWHAWQAYIPGEGALRFVASSESTPRPDGGGWTDDLTVNVGDALFNLPHVGTVTYEDVTVPDVDLMTLLAAFLPDDATGLDGRGVLFAVGPLS